MAKHWQPVGDGDGEGSGDGDGDESGKSALRTDAVLGGNAVSTVTLSRCESSFNGIACRFDTLDRAWSSFATLACTMTRTLPGATLLIVTASVGTFTNPANSLTNEDRSNVFTSPWTKYRATT